MRRITLVTSSEDKRIQYRDLLTPLGWDLDVVSLKVPEMQSIDCREVVKHKLEWARMKLHFVPLMVEDTAVHIQDLAGFPGALMKPLLETGGLPLIEKLSRSVQSNGRVAAYVESCIRIQVGKDLEVEGVGRSEGVLDFSGKGWERDPDCTGIFFLSGNSKSQRELAQEGDPILAYPHRYEALLKAVQSL